MLKKATIIRMLLVVLLVLAPFLFYVFYGPGFEIRITQSWGRVTRDKTEIETLITVNNPTPLSRWIKRIEFDLYINGFKIASEVSEKMVEVKPLRKTEISLTSFLNNSMILNLWVAYLNKGDLFEVELAGNATFSSITREIVCPIGYKTSAHTPLLELLSTKEPKEIKVGPATLTLRSLTLNWSEVTSAQTKIENNAVLYNPNSHPITITKIDYTIEMNDVKVGEGSMYNPIILEAKTDSNVSFTAILNNTMLYRWWPTHLRNDQITRIAVRVQGVGKVLGAEYSFLMVAVEGAASIRILGGTIALGFNLPLF